MTIVLFLVVLVALIVVHEFGHLIAAKLFHMRVDEFGIGYPPRAATFARGGGTDYTLNWLPFGGFVKIFGEDGDASGTIAPDSFAGKPHYQQALVLVAGIAMNVLFAWVLISGTLLMGAPRGITGEEAAGDPSSRVIVAEVIPHSPADRAGLAPGDFIVGAKGADAFDGHTAEAFTSFVQQEGKENAIALTIVRDGKTLSVSARPETGVSAASPSRAALGVAVADVTSAPVPLYLAPVKGAELTYDSLIAIVAGLAHFFSGLVTFSADLSQVSGPIGIAGALGAAAGNGFAALLSLTAVISLNLAVINLIPVPALDGGRLLFVAVEALTRRRIPEQVANGVNTVGFALLILLMLVVSAHDVLNLFG